MLTCSLVYFRPYYKTAVGLGLYISRFQSISQAHASTVHCPQKKEENEKKRKRKMMKHFIGFYFVYQGRLSLGGHTIQAPPNVDPLVEYSVLPPKSLKIPPNKSYTL